jgi:membrane protein DedA with SNARE-associated domain
VIRKVRHVIEVWWSTAPPSLWSAWFAGGFPAAINPAGAWWQYLILFMAVTASWAGVPAIGTAAAGAAAVSASQGHLGLVPVLVITIVAGEIGGLIGYRIGSRSGRELAQRPGKHQAYRPRASRPTKSGDGTPCSSPRRSSQAPPGCRTASS